MLAFKKRSVLIKSAANKSKFYMRKTRHKITQAMAMTKGLCAICSQGSGLCIAGGGAASPFAPPTVRPQIILRIQRHNYN